MAKLDGSGTVTFDVTGALLELLANGLSFICALPCQEFAIRLNHITRH